MHYTYAHTTHSHISPATDIQHNHIQQQHNGMYVYTSSVMHAVYGSIECTGGEPIFPAGCLRHNFVTPCDVHNKVSTRRGAKDKSRPRYGHARRCHTTSTCPSLHPSLHLSTDNPLPSNGQSFTIYLFSNGAWCWHMRSTCTQGDAGYPASPNRKTVTQTSAVVVVWWVCVWM